MDREEKLLVLYFITAFFALTFHYMTANERMAKEGYAPKMFPGNTEVFWYRVPQEQPELRPAF